MSSVQLDESVLNALKEFCKNEQELLGAAIFDSTGALIASEYKQTIPPEQLKAFANIFISEDDAFSSGLLLFDTLFDVHRFYPNEKPSLVYGRRNGDKSDSEGIGVLRVLDSDALCGQTLFLVTTFKLPCLTTRAITHLRDYARKYLMKSFK